jgi:PAS domain S-box-containing protein
MQPSLLTPGTLFYRVFHDSPVGMVITTIADGRYADVNKAYAGLLGYSRDELIGQRSPISMLENEDERNLVLEVLRRTYKLGDIPLLLETRYGEQRQCIGSIQLEEIGGAPYFISIIQDITQQEQAREALRFADNRFHLFFQCTPVPLIVYEDAMLAIIDVNNAACSVFGYSRDEFVGLNFTKLLPPEELASFRKNRDASGQPAEEQRLGRQLLKDGSIIDASIDSYTFTLDGRRVSLSIIQDVTERRAVQSALRDSEERLRIIADMTTDAIWDRDLATDDLEWSQGLSSLFGYSEEEYRPHDWWINRVHPDERETIEASIDAALASNESRWMAEYRFLHADGHYVNVLDRGFVIRDESGRPIRFIGAMVDITKPLQVAEVAANATMEERQRLARDLQDSVTQSLYSVSLMAEAARRRIASGERELRTEFIGRIGELSQQALRQLRLLLYELRPGVLEQEGLARALRHRLEAVEERAGVRGRLIDEIETPLPATLQSELFSIAQEVLNNLLIHTSATSVAILLKIEVNELIMEIGHDGHGFRRSTDNDGRETTELGQRVVALGGVLNVITRPGGAVVRVRVPMTSNAD